MNKLSALEKIEEIRKEIIKCDPLGDLPFLLRCFDVMQNIAEDYCDNGEMPSKDWKELIQETFEEKMKDKP